ncbi:MAG: subtype A tannase [Nocardioides sp.]|uniref:subtype A tannase n=1 Tax=Nocardioides sp. TaxID=35761 RepID=UPI0039E24583
MTELNRRTMLKAVGVTSLGALALTGCAAEASTSSSSSSSAGSATTSSKDTSLAFDDTAWSYDSDNDVYYQIGNYYVATPAAEDYESCGIYVPGAYLKASKNDEGNYTATIDDSGRVSGFSARTAPIVFPVNTPGYAAQTPPSSYSYDDVSEFLEAGFVYVFAGLRGKDSNTDDYDGNAPWGVTDLKAAVRYVRYNSDVLPGSTERIFVFGHSGGGAQSSIMGTTGDIAAYRPYLKSLGAAMTDTSGKTISDAVAGVMAWCPITNLDYANAAYEWNMGQFSSSGTRASGTWTAAYSDDLATAFAGYLNKLKLKSPAGKTLKLKKSASGRYLAGSYYDYVVGVITTSLNNFLSDTTFPYTPSNSTMAGMDTGGSSGDAPTGDAPTGDAPSGAPSGGAAPSGSTDSTGSTGSTGSTDSTDSTDSSGSSDSSSSSSSSSSSTTYETVEDYIDYLNSDTEWVSYDSSSNTATVLSLEGFVNSQKSASKDVGAFDGIDRGETENVVLGSGTDGLHFAPVSRDLIAAHRSSYSALDDWSSDYAAAEYTSDFTKTDSIGKDVLTRSDMYNPMYFLNRYYDGYGSSTIAPHWRIRTGIMQGDTANTTEINLMLALNAVGVKNIDFATVWGQGHTMAERTGDATTNFISWVKKSVRSS